MTTTNPDLLSLDVQKAASEVCRTQLEQVLRKGALRLLIQALELEVEDYLGAHADLHDENGRRQVVRNGHAQPRTVQTGVGPIEPPGPTRS